MSVEAAGNAPKIRVAVLGGGIGSLSTAFELTRTPELRAKYDVTFYQLGWRLGGKGASGRNAEIAQRIEEHGLHIWMGFYENAFRAMRAAYEELGRKPGAPLATWTEAFHQHSYIVLEEPFGDALVPWQFVFPTNDLEPGTGGVLPTPCAYLSMLLQWMVELWEACPLAHGDASQHPRAEVPSWIAALLGEASYAAESAVDHAQGHGSVLASAPPAPTHPVSVLAHAALGLAQAHSMAEGPVAALFERAIAWLIEAAMEVAWWLLEGRVQQDFDAHKLWVGLNLAGATAAGMVADDVLQRGWDSIDHHDLRSWLARHGANALTLRSGLVRGVYDLAFAYRAGNTADPGFAAGTATRGMLRMLFTYKGAIFFRMQAGMGDVVVTPFYEVLRRRGVTFQFFHRARALRLSPDRALVSAIELTRQVELADGVARYEPLVDVKGLPCWPSAPLYAQIRDGAELKASGINLESSWAPAWKGETPVRLELGRDFDHVVVGVSIAALREIAGELIDASDALARSVENVQTVQTQASQLWLTETADALGFRRPEGVHEGAVLGAFYEPIDTWADMSDLLPREAWPDDARPLSLAYFCGPLRDATPTPPFSDHGFPARELARYRGSVRDFMNAQLGALWPNALAGDTFMWELLVDLEAQRGPARLASQYTRVNLDPTERYVLSLPGSTQYRLRANQLPFANVTLAGDWTYNGLNAGCVEAAVMSGMLASRAICGEPRQIVGEER